MLFRFISRVGKLQVPFALYAHLLWCSASCRSFMSALGWLWDFQYDAQKLSACQLCEAFKCFLWSSRKLCVPMSILIMEQQIISQVCWDREEMNFKTQLYKVTILFILLVFFESSQKYSYGFSQPQIKFVSVALLKMNGGKKKKKNQAKT